MSNTQTNPAPKPMVAPDAKVSRLADRLLGWTGGLMIVAAAVLLFFGGEGDSTQAAAPPGAVPVLRLQEPQTGSVVEGPLEILFTVGDAELSRMPSGWGAEGLHLHAEIDGVEYMPAATDIARMPGGGYRWTFAAPLPPGTHTVRLSWSDTDHRPLEEGASATARVHVP